MAKPPAFQFYPADWLRDPQIQMSTMETRGVWFELLCNMWFAPERGKIEGDKDDICRMLGCSKKVFDRALDEIKRLKIGDVDVTICDSSVFVTVINRRMSREEKVRKSARLRKRSQRLRERSHATVTPPSSSSSSRIGHRCDKSVTKPGQEPPKYKDGIQVLKKKGML